VQGKNKSMILLARNMQRNLRKSFYAQGLSQWQLWLSSAHRGFPETGVTVIFSFFISVALIENDAKLHSDLEGTLLFR
jgi:hypothetical protein